MTDKKFVREAMKRWGNIIDYANKPDRDDGAGAVAAAMWATIYVDRLLKIAASHTGVLT